MVRFSAVMGWREFPHLSSPELTYFPICLRRNMLLPHVIKDGISRHENQGAVHATDHHGCLIPGTGRLRCVRSGLDDRRGVRYRRVLLPVLQLAQASVQARAQFELPLVQVGYQADVGGRGECERRQMGAHYEKQPGVARPVLAVAYYGPCLSNFGHARRRTSRKSTASGANSSNSSMCPKRTGSGSNSR